MHPTLQLWILEAEEIAERKLSSLERIALITLFGSHRENKEYAKRLYAQRKNITYSQYTHNALLISKATKILVNGFFQNELTFRRFVEAVGM